MRPISGMVPVLTAASCGDATGPLAALSELRSSLALVDPVFASPLVRSLGFFQLVPRLPPPTAGAPLLPDSLLGKTLAWSCTSQRYAVTGDSGAPATGIRFVLSTRAPDGPIACPAVALGHVDLFDASAPGTTALRGAATGPSGDAPLVVYTISHNATDAQGVASATGFVSGGQQRPGFQASGAPGSGFNTRVATLQLDDSAAGLHALLHHSAVMGGGTTSDDPDLSVRHAAPSAEPKGPGGGVHTPRAWGG